MPKYKIKDRWVQRICQGCGKKFDARISYVKRGQMKYCSRKCQDFKGEKNSNWRGGKRITRKGYILIYSPIHPFADVNKECLEHRLIMENHIGRYLKSAEVVHHINGIKYDNRLENLKLFINEKEHQKIGHATR